MKRMTLWLSASAMGWSVWLSGCSVYQPTNAAPPVTEVDVCMPPAAPPRPEPVDNGNRFPDLESLLAFRQQVCQLSSQERNALRDQYREQETEEGVMWQLMVATCQPDQTPGLLVNSLALARDIDNTPGGFDALLDLLEAQASSYALIEGRLRSTKQRLEDTIEGIRAIEAEMVRNNGGSEGGE